MNERPANNILQGTTIMNLTKIPKSLYLVLGIFILTIGTILFLPQKAPAQSKAGIPATTQQLSSTNTQPTSETDIAGWNTYRNQEVGFEVKYPKGSEIQGEGVAEFKGRTYKQSFVVHIALPFSKGSLLENKVLTISTEKAPPEHCSDPFNVYPPNIAKMEIVYIKDIEFKRELKSYSTPLYDMQEISYSTIRRDQCITLTFSLASDRPSGAKPQLDFDRENEIQVFDQILSTFRFTK